jgi:hypothetical protein
MHRREHDILHHASPPEIVLESIYIYNYFNRNKFALNNTLFGHTALMGYATLYSAAKKFLKITCSDALACLKHVTEFT